MKRNFHFYIILWAILFFAFFAVVFLVRPVILGEDRVYDVRFWIVFLSVVVSFVGNFICAYFAFKVQNLKKMFYYLPLIMVSFGALITILIVGCGLMLIPNCPAWIATIICFITLAANATPVIKSAWAADRVDRIDDNLKTKTFFIRSLTVNAEGLLAGVENEEIKVACKKVYEAVRYSDPMSSEELAGIEYMISGKFEELAAAVANRDAKKAKATADELLALIGDRNRKCKLLK